jgi:methanogenic corrinoid protein MtbC1
MSNKNTGNSENRSDDSSIENTKSNKSSSSGTDLNRVMTAYMQATYDTDRDRALKIVHDAVDSGVSPEDVVLKVVAPAIEQMVSSIGKNYELNLAQHFMVSQIASEVIEEMIPKFKNPPEAIGRIIIGTAQGDLHSLGKRIVIGSLKALMIDPIDLGVNVPPEKFVDEAVANHAQVIAISAMMVHTATSPNGPLAVRRILKERGLENKIKIVVGGAPYRFNPDLYKEVGADAWADDGISAGKIIADLIKND